jgi:hypothetical protein
MHSHDNRYTHCCVECSVYGSPKVMKGEQFARIKLERQPERYKEDSY